MGLAASQARFLGITLRKANCEFKSTQLAEQKLQISNQLADVSQEYSNAMQATKLLWCNDACTADYGLSYGLIMMPSAANDYNPYMITSKSGAIILNANYAAAAKAAGIGMNGGIATAAGRDIFIQTLSATGVGLTDIYGQPVLDINGQQKKIDIGLATAETSDRILHGIVDSSGVTIEKAVEWNSSVGMGAAPEDKGVQDAVTLYDLINNNSIGGASLDWLQMYTKEGVYTENEWNIATSKYMQQRIDAKNAYMAADPTHTFAGLNAITDILENASSTEYVQMNTALTPTEEEQIKNGQYNTSFNVIGGTSNTYEDIIKQFKKLEYLSVNGNNNTEKQEALKQLQLLKQGKGKDGVDFSSPEPSVYGILWAYYDYYAHKPDGVKISWGDSTTAGLLLSDFLKRDESSGKPTVDSKIKMEDLFQNTNSEIENKNSDSYQMTVITNGVITTNESSLKNMTIADLLTNDVVIMNWWHEQSGGQDAIEEMSYRVLKLMEYIAEIFGYGHIGTGLNVDETTDQALNLALTMIEKKFLKAGNAIFLGNAWNSSNVTQCSSYNNANDFNRIGADRDKNTAAVNLSNMVSAFLTYFDNYLRGTESQYTVGKANDENEDSKTYFVTDDPTYVYVTNTPEQMSLTQKIADFYDMLYNNLCAHGWREDGSVDQSEYLESMIKDGRYQMMSLNEDGYFYQTRYNHTGYMKEVTDEDKITRAEAAYTKKKAELTYKEDAIDVKTKKLDAEIAELSTEINSVQNFISKSIEKTFAMFSS